VLKIVALAVKNVFRNGKRSASLGLNYAIVAFIMTALLAFSRGAALNVSTSLVRATAGHVTISGQYARGGRIYNGLLRVPEIEELARGTLGAGVSVLPRYLMQSMVYYKGLSRRVGFTGVEAGLESGLRSQMAFSSGSWEDWAADPSGVVLPSDTAAYFGIVLGDELVVSARTRFGAFNTGILKVRGVYSTSNYFMNGLMLVGFGFLRSLDMAPSDAATTLYLYLPRPEGIAAARDRLSAALAAAGFEVSRPKSDTEAIAAVSAASVRYEADKEGRDRVMAKLSTIDEVLGLARSVIGAVDAIGGLVAAVMLIVIAASIFINLRMAINERMREIGTMRAIGFQSRTVTALFVIEAAALAAMFSAAGSALGALACLAARAFLRLPADGNLAILLDSGRLALEPRLADMGALVLLVAALAALFAFLPARRGGRIPPVEALASTF
jgi:putative ABC transport system permease protein